MSCAICHFECTPNRMSTVTQLSAVFRLEKRVSSFGPTNNNNGHGASMLWTGKNYSWVADYAVTVRRQNVMWESISNDIICKSLVLSKCLCVQTYGCTPSRPQLDTYDNSCPICQDKFSNPISLSCTVRSLLLFLSFTSQQYSLVSFCFRRPALLYDTMAE